ncbi:hypothetical protein TWF106_004986 [Orbilia oligospora]|uniref:Carbohydrate esterase family 16 protein n=1 Tax=Orbilia oligospora TaxID=2813651 RepID=A0A7C8Q574_ORBOL|nr:hypothetical protein TWF106_004986 [Orbilia oligospora]KAF3196987.1 hypothetical protein TWF679_003810 [Orbilia oligospora]
MYPQRSGGNDDHSCKHYPRHDNQDNYYHDYHIVGTNFVVFFVCEDKFDNYEVNHDLNQNHYILERHRNIDCGDSYTQTGFDPNGVQPAIGNPLGNPPYPGWTSANGPNWIDVATVKYNRSLVLTYNLAYGGATIDANLVQPYASNVLSLTDQTNQFLTYYANKPASAPWSSSNTLFSVFIGINDIANSWWKPDWLTFIDTLLTAEFALVEKMYNSGGRQFLISNIPAIERTPMMLADTQAARDGLKAALALWSTKLQTYITNFKATHSGTTFWFYDSYADYNTVLNSPATFGMNPDVTLYGNDLTYAWSNNFHPSVIIQDYMGKRVADLLASWW